MAKIALDSLEPAEACFESNPNTANPTDHCKLTVKFHVSDEKTTYPPVKFQREKDRFIIDPNTGSGDLAVLTALFPAAKIDSMQSALHFSVAISKLYRNAYPTLESGMKQNGEIIYPYRGPQLKPFLNKVTSFYSTGNILNPDPIQSSSNSALTREALNLPHPPRAWSLKLYKSLLDPRVNLNMTPEDMRPRVQWFIDQLECMDQLISPWVKASSNSSTDPVDLALAPQSDIYQLYVDILDSLFNNTNITPAQIMSKMDPIAARIFASKELPENRKDFYLFLRNKFSEFSQKTSFTRNLPARQKLNTLIANLNAAIEEHRAELLSLEPNAALQKSIEYKLSFAASRGVLGKLVETELNEAHLNTKWIQENSNEITQALLPHFHLVKGLTPTSNPRIEINSEGIRASIVQLTNLHGIQKREYQIGALAILRHLLGSNLSNSKMTVWHQGSLKELEVNVIGKGGLKNLSLLGQELSTQIGKSVIFTEKNLPWMEAGVGVVGVGLGATGIGLNGFRSSALTTAGASVFGFGAASFTCNKLFHTRNKIISDLSCGAIGAVGFGLAAQFLLPQKDGSFSFIDSGNSARNPTTGFGP